MRFALLLLHRCARLTGAPVTSTTARAHRRRVARAPKDATGRGGGTALTIDRRAQPNAIGIGYSGGPVMLGTPDVYYIWYGNWSGNSATTLLPDFMSNLGGSPYFNINTTYYDSQGRHITEQIHYAGIDHR